MKSEAGNDDGLTGSVQHRSIAAPSRTKLIRHALREHAGIPVDVLRRHLMANARESKYSAIDAETEIVCCGQRCLLLGWECINFASSMSTQQNECDSPRQDQAPVC